MTEEPRSTEQQAEDDELARIVEALEEAGLAETYERPDGTVAVRLTELGEGLRKSLPSADELGEVEGQAQAQAQAPRSEGGF